MAINTLFIVLKLPESKTSGVIDNNVSSTINQQAYTALDKLGQATGIKIKIVESIDSPDGTRKDIANGQFVGDMLEISKSSDNPLLRSCKT